MTQRSRATARSAARPAQRAATNARTRDARGENAHLRALRDGLGMTRAEFARLLGTTQRSIAAWEGGREPGDAHARAITQVRRIWKTAGNVMKSEHVGDWIRTPLEALGGLKPMEAIERGEHDRLWRVLFAVESGGFG